MRSSGSLAQAPFGDTLGSRYSKSNYVRLYCYISISSVSQLPSLWVFLLVVLGMLLLMIGVTSLLMHRVQKRRRQRLGVAIALGEVDLESLRIKEPKIPQKIIDDLPIFVYVAKEEEDEHAQTSLNSVTNNTQTNRNNKTTRPKSDDIFSTNNLIVSEESRLPSATSLPHQTLSFFQPTCSICLEDFESHKTIVRSLPCTHGKYILISEYLHFRNFLLTQPTVFHPSCVDLLLGEYSSLCPICKGKVLSTASHCPVEVTNAMVRRERASRVQRQRTNVLAEPSNTETLGVRSISGRRLGRVASHHRQSGPVGRAQEPPLLVVSGSVSGAVELSQVNSPNSVNRSVNVGDDASPDYQPLARPPGVSREEWARQRAHSIFGGHGTTDEGRNQEPPQSRCKFLASNGMEVL